ncbi:hypothetical protein BH09ACT1_BH09ACT1_02210 [soil metagenome]
MSKLDSRGFRIGFATFVLFTGIAGDFWRDALTWYGYGVMVALGVAGSIVLLRRHSTAAHWKNLPYPLLAFFAFCLVSITWSDYPLYTTLGAFVQLITAAAGISIAITLSWGELLVALGWALRLILGFSFVFEFIVSVFIRHPIFPVWVVPDDPEHPAALLYWSRNLLFDGAKIQGIVGNSSLLAMAALLALITFAIQFASRSVNRFWGGFWILVSLLTIAITRSATIFAGLAVVIAVAAIVLLVRRANSPRGRALIYGVLVIVLAAFVVAGTIFRTPLLGLLGKTSTLTGRVGIWEAVIRYAHERPAFGWGWLGYWIPWIEPFKSLDVVRGGVQVLHAHDAWLDVWLQVGIVGLVIFIIWTFSTLARSWLIAKDRIITEPNTLGKYSWVSLLPLLMFSAQLIQSIAESRMLLEGGLMLLVIWSVKTKLHPVAEDPVRGPK